MAIKMPKMFTSKQQKDKILKYLKILVKVLMWMFGINRRVKTMVQVNLLII